MVRHEDNGLLSRLTSKVYCCSQPAFVRDVRRSRQATSGTAAATRRTAMVVVEREAEQPPPPTSFGEQLISSDWASVICREIIIHTSRARRCPPIRTPNLLFLAMGGHTTSPKMTHAQFSPLSLRCPTRRRPLFHGHRMDPGVQGRTNPFRQFCGSNIVAPPVRVLTSPVHTYTCTLLRATHP